MYNCIYASINEHAKSKVIADNILMDGPTLLYKIMQSAHATTFTCQFTLHERLQRLHPKHFNYDISKQNLPVEHGTASAASGRLILVR